MRRQHNVKKSGFQRGIRLLPTEMREFVKPTRVAHVWARSSVLSDKEDMDELSTHVRKEHKAVPVFHKFARTVAKVRNSQQ